MLMCVELVHINVRWNHVKEQYSGYISSPSRSFAREVINKKDVGTRLHNIMTLVCTLFPSFSSLISHPYIPLHEMIVTNLGWEDVALLVVGRPTHHDQLAVPRPLHPT